MRQQFDGLTELVRKYALPTMLFVGVVTTQRSALLSAAPFLIALLGSVRHRSVLRIFNVQTGETPMKKSRMSESSRRTIIKATGAIGAATASNALAASSGKAQVGLSLSEVSTFGATFRDDVHAYKAAGFDAIGVWEYKIPHKESDNQIISSLHEAQLRVATCVPTVSTILPGEMLGMGPPRSG